MTSLRDWLISRGHSHATVIVPDIDWSWKYWLDQCDTFTWTENLIPSDIPDEIVSNRSVVRALFAPNTYDFSVDPLFEYDIAQLNLPDSFRKKIQVLMDPVILAPSDSDTTYNLLGLNDEDKSMLQLYCAYKRGDLIALPDYESLTRPVAKLVYTYIRLLKDKDASTIPNEPLSTKNDPIFWVMLDIFVRVEVYRKTISGENITLP